MRFVWIPGGTFKMGHDGDPPESSPAHAVRVSSFFMAETAVTNRQYRMFLEQTGHPEPEFWRDPRFSDPDQPAVGVRFGDALAFCGWLAETSGLVVDLPTEAEWEYGARGSDGRRYPWGNEAPSAERACYEEDAMEGRPAKVGSYPKGRGAHGTFDQAGNVWEWCRDTWDPMAYLKRSRVHARDPVVEDGQAGVQVVRGGSWFFPPEDLAATSRGKNQAEKSADDLGFRVALRLSLPRSEARDAEILELSVPTT
jgi:formylglycine-generating enzyme required for sulfatase activity